MSTLRPHLELLRVFLIPTAPSDSIAGFVLAATLSDRGIDVPRLAATIGASIGLYSFGLVANDLFDLAKDRRTAPGKPLPSGRVSLRVAIVLAVVLAASGLGLATLAGALPAAGAILVLVLAYDGGGKRIPIVGNLLMGACRGGNFLLGATAASGLEVALTNPPVVAGAIVLGLFVAAITAVSVLEDRPYRALTFHALATPVLLIPLGLGVLQVTSGPAWINCIALLWLLIKWQRRASSRRLPAHPAAVYVRGALSGIFLVDAGLLWTFGPTGRVEVAALAIYGLALVAACFKWYWLHGGGADT